MYFVNLTCNTAGGAVYAWNNAMIHIGARTRVVFMNNTASNSDSGDVGGGAVFMSRTWNDHCRC